jgi:hypothetical protein
MAAIVARAGCPPAASERCLHAGQPHTHYKCKWDAKWTKALSKLSLLCISVEAHREGVKRPDSPRFSPEVCMARRPCRTTTQSAISFLRCASESHPCREVIFAESAASPSSSWCFLQELPQGLPLVSQSQPQRNRARRRTHNKTRIQTGPKRIPLAPPSAIRPRSVPLADCNLKPARSAPQIRPNFPRATNSTRSSNSPFRSAWSSSNPPSPRFTTR